jgi:hypothetical protein
LKNFSFHHNLWRTRTIKPEPDSGSCFGLAHSRWVSRSLVKGNAGSGNEIALYEIDLCLVNWSMRVSDYRN